MGGGLSRRGSLYDEVDEDGRVTPGIGSYDYAGLVRGSDGSARVEVGSGRIPKAKSEAALLVQRSKNPSKSAQAKKARLYQMGSRTGGTNTPRIKKGIEDDWLTRTGAATNALLQESKGQSWTASSTALAAFQDSTDEDDDEGYEELAAQSVADPSRREYFDGELSPMSVRASRWGSRYGSRTGSRRTSRRGSVTLTTGSRTPLATATLVPDGGDYFDSIPDSLAIEPDFVDEENESQDEASLNRLAETHAFGVGGIIDRIMNLSLFSVEEKEEATEDDDVKDGDETEEQARERREAEKKRKREEKEKLVQRSAVGSGEDGREGDAGEGGGGWVSDAAWLLSVASKAIF